MAQVSYGTITITDNNDIEKIYMEYAQSTSNKTAPTSGWNTDIPTWQQGKYIWQRTVTKMSGVALSSDSYGEPVCLTGSTGSTGAAGRSVSSIVTTYCNYGDGTPADNYSGWQSTVPAYDSTKPNYWVKTDITYSNPTETSTTKYKDNGITSATSTAAAANSLAQTANNTANQAKETAGKAKTIAEGANSAISDLNQYFWRQKTATTNVPAGSYVTNIPGTTYKNNPANGGFNSLVQANGIFLRNGITTLSSWTSNALNFYNPTTGNADITLDSNGLKLNHGGLIGGISRTDDFVFLSSMSFDDAISGHDAGTVSLDNYTNTDWRQLIGTKFGVRADGTLYASGAVISGDLTIIGHSDNLATELSAMQTDIENNLIYDHTYEIDSTGDTINAVTFTAHIYRSGEEVTSEFSDDNFTWYYKNENAIDKLPLNNNTSRTIQNSGKTITISTTSTVTLEDVLSFGAEVIGCFTLATAQNLLDNDGDTLSNSENQNLTGVTETGNSIRVRDLELTTTVNTSDKLLIVTPEAEKIVNLSTILNLAPGTVSSVRIRAANPVQSSVSSAQTNTLDTTISLADNYGDIKNPYGTKQASYVLAGPTSGTNTPSFRLLTTTDIPDLSSTYLTISTAQSALVNSITTSGGAHTVITNSKGNVNLTIPTKVSHLINDSGFLSVETDPVFSASPAANITATDISNWNSVSSKAEVQIIRWNE